MTTHYNVLSFYGGWVVGPPPILACTAAAAGSYPGAVSGRLGSRRSTVLRAGVLGPHGVWCWGNIAELHSGGARLESSLSEAVRGSPQSLQVNSRLLFLLDRDRFLSDFHSSYHADVYKTRYRQRRETKPARW
jgi:hypothetical protein